MQKCKTILFIIVFSLALLPRHSYAVQVTVGRVDAVPSLRIRSNPGTNYEKIGNAEHDSIVTILEYAESGNGCDDKWVKIKSADNIQGYVCSTFIVDIKTVDVPEVENPSPEISETGEQMAAMTDEEFDAYLNSQGFPESYKVKLKELHKKHPTWIFKGIKTKESWSKTLEYQNSSGNNLYHVSPTDAANGYEGYLSTLEPDYNHDTDTFIRHDGDYWYQANSETVSYFLDPRNFLTEKSIFMFEELFYHPTYQTSDVTRNTLSSDFLKQYTSYFMEAAERSKVSPIFLASLVKQEVGTSTNNICSNGKAGVLSDGVNYTGYYNFFNIGASSSTNPKLMSLKYAKSSNWNTPQKAIVEGSTFVSERYVNCGQQTSYFQKFNVSINATKPNWHQYTTNVDALTSPAVSAYNSYNKFGLIEKDFVFVIPVFEGMPESTKLPNLGNPNNYLKDLKVNNSLVTNFNNEVSNYTINIPYAESVQISATSINSKATISGVGSIPLTDEKTIANVVVTAQNKSVRTYSLTIIRGKKPDEVVTPPIEDKEPGENVDTPDTPITPDEPIVVNLDDVIKKSGYNYKGQYISKITLGTSVNTVINNILKNSPTVTVNITDRNNKPKTTGIVVTGDKVTVSSNGNTKVVEIVIYGDINGDGVINTLDLLNVKKSILKQFNLTGAYKQAADVNKDGTINTLDLLYVKKHILKQTNISQG